MLTFVIGCVRCGKDLDSDGRLRAVATSIVERDVKKAAFENAVACCQRLQIVCCRELTKNSEHEMKPCQDECCLPRSNRTSCCLPPGAKRVEERPHHLRPPESPKLQDGPLGRNRRNGTNIMAENLLGFIRLDSRR